MPLLQRLFGRSEPDPEPEAPANTTPPLRVVPGVPADAVLHSTSTDWSLRETLSTTSTFVRTYVDESWVAWNQTYTVTSHGGIYSRPMLSQTSSSLSSIETFYDTSYTWGQWNGVYRRTDAPVVPLRSPAIHTPSPEELERRRVLEEQQAARDAVWRAEAEARRQEQVAADRRADALLMSVLNPEQRRDWVAAGAFYLHVGDKRYRIKRGRAGNVELVDGAGASLQRYCCHVADSVPDADNVLTQMMLLLHDEQHFLAKTNVPFTKKGFRRPDLPAEKQCEAA